MPHTLVLIPAFGCDARLYAPQIAALGARLAIDVIVPEASSYSAMVEQVLAQAPERFAVLGTSMGGRLALETALAAPERVAGLGVIGAGAGGVADPAAGLRRSQRIRGGEQASVVREMAEMIAHMAGPRGAEAKRCFMEMGMACSPDVLARQSDALAGRVDRWADMAGVTCPTLCLWGRHDQFSPAKDGLRLAQSVQNGTFVELPECGHFPTLEYPDESTEAILRWLAACGLIANS